MAIKKVTEIDLKISRPDFMGRDECAILELETDKASRGGVESTATVFWVQFHSRSHAFGLGAPGGDYSRVCAKLPGAATQKRIDTLHAETFTPELIAEITEQARAVSQANADRQKRERDRETAAQEAMGPNYNGMAAAVSELIDSGIPASRALAMCNVD